MPQAVAPLVAARRRHLHWAFGVAPSPRPASLPDGGTGDTIGLKVELFVGSAWIDVSSYVRYENRVRVTRGRPDETSVAPPQLCTFTLDNRDGRFSPRNPVGPYYGLIGRNTPVRVSRLNNGVRRYRFYGEVPAWPMVSDISGNEVTVTIQAAGMLRRLNQGATPLRSALFRAYTLGYSSNQFNPYTPAPLAPLAYWPCEDGASATSFASGLSGGTSMTVSGAPTFANSTAFACSAALPLLSASTWTGTVPVYTGGTANIMRFLLSVPSTGAFDTGVIARMYTTGTVARVDAAYSASSGGSLTITGYDGGGNSLLTQSLTITVGTVTGINGVPIMVTVELTTVGGSVQGLIGAFAISSAASFAGASSSTTGTLGNATQIVINPAGSITNSAVGHVTFQSAYDVLTNIYAAATAYNPDSPIVRFARLCGEQNVPATTRTATLLNDSGDPTGMGAQGIDTFPNLIQQCADALYTPIFEARDQMSLAMRSKGTMYNQAAKLTLDMSAHQLSGPLVPVDDDALTRNDVTVSATAGSSGQAVQTAAPLSVQPFPAGVGDYAMNYPLNLSATTSLLNQASMRLRFGTVDEPRYPHVPINLRHPTFTTNVDLMNAALTIDIGDRLVINNPPAPDYPPDPISLIVQGYTETLGIFEHDVVFNCSPESPWRVGILDDAVLGRLDTDGSTLALAAGAADATLSVATTNSASPLWTTSAGDFPFDVVAGGERMTVTNITGVSSPQIFAVTRSMNGPVVALGADGTFETGTTGWTPSSGTFVTSTALTHSGTQSGLLTVTGSPSQTITRTPNIPVVGGAGYSLFAWLANASGSPSVLTAIDWYDAGNAYISTSFSPSATAAAAFTQFSFTATAPANAAFAQIGPSIVFSPAAGNAIYVDDVVLTTAMKSQTAGTDVRLQQPLYLSL